MHFTQKFRKCERISDDCDSSYNDTDLTIPIDKCFDKVLKKHQLFSP